MSFLKKKWLWFTVYGIFITLVFMYLLFPGDLVKSRLEDKINTSDFMIKSASLHPALPLGINLKNVTLSSQVLDNVFFQGELLDLQLNIRTIFRKNIYIGFSGNAYEGSFDGLAGLVSIKNAYPPSEVILNIENVEIGKYPLLKGELGKSFTGKASGTLTYSTDEATKSASGTVSLFLKKGSYALVEPFLGVNKIDFDRGEIQAQFKNGILKLEKLEIFGPQVNCFLKGEITAAANLKNSQININGTIEILGKDKIKMIIAISGTLANPQVRYI